MKTFTLITLSNPVPGRETEFNDWYDNQHVHDVLAAPGFVTAQRFEIASPPVRAQHPYRYCAVYEIVTADPDRTLREMLSRVGGESMSWTQAISEDIYAVLFEARSAPVRRTSPG